MVFKLIRRIKDRREAKKDDPINNLPEKNNMKYDKLIMLIFELGRRLMPDNKNDSNVPVDPNTKATWFDKHKNQVWMIVMLVIGLVGGNPDKIKQYLPSYMDNKVMEERIDRLEANVKSCCEKPANQPQINFSQTKNGATAEIEIGTGP